MKRILYIVCFLILVSGVFAADMEITDVRGYVNDNRDSAIDEDGGSMDAKPSDSIDYIVTIKNNLNQSGQVKLKLTVDNIDDGNDLKKELDWTAIDALSDKSKMLSFVVPDDSSYDDYPTSIVITYKYNSSESTITLDDYELTIKKITSEASLEDALSNMTHQCTLVTSGLNTCFGYINDSRLKTDELSTCKEQRGQFETNFNNCNTNLNDCSNKKATCEAEKSALGTRITQDECTTLYVNPAIQKEQSTRNNLIAVAVVLAIGGFGYWKYKQKNLSVDSAYLSR